MKIVRCSNGIYLLLLSLFWSLQLMSQNTVPKIRFAQSDIAQFGFDGYNVVQWSSRYQSLTTTDSLQFRVSYKSILKDSVDHVNLVLNSSVDSLPKLSFEINDSIYELKYSHISRDTLDVELPVQSEDYLLQVYLNDKLESALQVFVYDAMTFKVKLVPLARSSLDEDSLRNYLNGVFSQAGVSLNVAIESYFKFPSGMDSLFSNPSTDHDRYTDQMIELRDFYFEKRGKDRNTYYIFLISGFVSENVQGYMVRNKAIGFVKYHQDDLYREIAHQLGFGIGSLDDFGDELSPADGTTENLMDISGTLLTHYQWKLIRESGSSVSYYDDFENVRTNNGLIAYYMWEELEDGTIRFVGDDPRTGIERPFKNNTFSLHLNIDNFLFYQLFDVFEFPICLLHIIGLVLMLLSSFWLRKRVMKKWSWINRKWILRMLFRTVNFSTHIWFFWLLFLLINEGYYLFEVQTGKLEHLSGIGYREVKKDLWSNDNVRRKEEDNIGSEILIRRKNDWWLEKRQQVLYFDVIRKGGKEVLRFSKDADELHLPTVKFRKKATSHYFVFRYKDEHGAIKEEKVYNHIGVNITKKLTLKDPAERILLFVNGYRPTSLGASFEENFDDIQKKGLEFDNSMNLVYDFDRYDYWNQWNEFDTKFGKRINPTATYYADGHHSVTTSNHETLIDFTELSITYPKRCKNPKRHVCKTTKKGWKWIGLEREIPTYETQHVEPNVEGFNERRTNGKIAGRNLYQMLNELPSNSSNDTLYIVAHSMGYAYALGIIDKLRGKINFGGFYIIAPENAESGKVHQSEWNEIWQYGSDFEANKTGAPCLLDGIASQTKADGLSPRKRVYIPDDLYTRMGFFESHFIGNYTWIFDVPRGKPGHVSQR